MYDDREIPTKDTKEHIKQQDPEFDRIVGKPRTLKEGDFVKIEGIVFEISAIHPETKKGKRTIKLKQPFFEKSKEHSFEPFPYKNQEKCPRTPTWMRTGRHG